MHLIFPTHNKGMLKVISKMGISTLRGYRGSQIFEAVGLGQKILDTHPIPIIEVEE